MGLLPKTKISFSFKDVINLPNQFLLESVWFWGNKSVETYIVLGDSNCAIGDCIILSFNLSNLDTLRNLIFNCSGKVEGNYFWLEA